MVATHVTIVVVLGHRAVCHARIMRLKEYGLGTQSLGLNFPLSEVGTPPPHNSGMAYGPVTENNNNI